MPKDGSTLEVMLCAIRENFLKRLKSEAYNKIVFNFIGGLDELRVGK